MTVYEKSRAFIYRNARPIDLAVFRHEFENAPADDIITALSAFQNPDGGFGHAIEPDNFNPLSVPMGAWKATEYIRDAGGLPASHPIIKGILRYLDSGDGFDTEHDQWANTVPSNNSAPCAIWWKYPENGGEFKYNPTAALAGFIVRYAEKGSALYGKGVKLVSEAADWYIKNAPIEQHVAHCFITMDEDCKSAGETPYDREALLKKLDEIVDKSVCREPARWWEYLPRPSAFIDSRRSRFYHPDLEALCLAECKFISDTQNPDGSFYVPWTWCNDHTEWYVAENWCKAIVTIDNLRFLREFSPEIYQRQKQ